jgi:hypothetical protein
MSGDRKPMVQLATLWERTSANGNRYFSGFLNGNSILLFDGGEQDHPTKPGERVHVWNLVLQERDQAPRSSTRNAERGQRQWDRARDVERHAARTRASQAGNALVDHAPDRPFYDGSDEAVGDLEGRGR